MGADKWESVELDKNGFVFEKTVMFLIWSICLSSSAGVSFMSHYLVPSLTILIVLFLLKILNIFTVIYALIHFNLNKKHMYIYICKENNKEIGMEQKHDNKTF